MSYIYNGKHTHINTQSQPDGLSKVFIFFSRRGLHSRHSLFCFFLSWYRPPPVSPCDSQWAERRKRRVEAAGAPRRFYPLLHPTSFFFLVHLYVCVYALGRSHNSLLRLLEDAVQEGVWGAFLWPSFNSPLTPQKSPLLPRCPCHSHCA